MVQDHLCILLEDLLPIFMLVLVGVLLAEFTLIVVKHIGEEILIRFVLFLTEEIRPDLAHE